MVLVPIQKWKQLPVGLLEINFWTFLRFKTDSYKYFESRTSCDPHLRISNEKRHTTSYGSSNNDFGYGNTFRNEFHNFTVHLFPPTPSEEHRRIWFEEYTRSILFWNSIETSGVEVYYKKLRASHTVNDSNGH